jgi:hypothetical protein
MRAKAAFEIEVALMPGISYPQNPHPRPQLPILSLYDWKKMKKQKGKE